jgi:ribosomal protein L11 methyltransferase
MGYARFCFSFNADTDRDILLAMLGNYPFEVFEEEEQSILAYLPGTIQPESLFGDLSSLALLFPFCYTVEKLPEENWNIQWESNFSPISVGNFCHVRADFHPPLQGFKYELVITPKMAFGTGHHETTFMMMEAMKSIDFQNKQVLDFGCGTGILAILAAKLGAREVIALDIEEPAIENAKDNAVLNGVEAQIIPILGVLQTLAMSEQDIILANINRNVILDELPSLKKRMRTSALLLLSGILWNDWEFIALRAQELDLQLIQVNQKGDWMMGTLCK